MPDEEIAFAQLIGTLRDGQDALAEAMDLLNADGSGRTDVDQFLETTSDLADLAQTLVLVMSDSGADEAALQDANDLAAFFWTTEESLEAKLGLGRG